MRRGYYERMIGQWLGVALLLVCGLWFDACAGKNKAERLHDEGTLLWKHAKYYKAIDKFEAALKLEPERPRTLAKLADCYLRTNRPETAITFANQALAKQSDLDEANLVLGQSLLALANNQTSRTLGSERQADPKLLAQAAEIASKLRKKKPNAPEGMLLQAEVDIQNQHPELAEQLYHAVLRDHPKETQAQLGLARVLMQQQKLAEAETLLRQMIDEEKPPNSQAVLNLALTLSFERKFEEAWNTLQPSLNEKNKEPELSHYLLAGRVLLAQLQAAQNGAIDSTNTLTTTRNAPATTATLAQGTGKVDIKQAIKRLEDLGSDMKGKWPGRPESWYFRGLSYQFQNNIDEAIRHYQEAVRRSPEERDYRLALAGAHIQQRQFQLAREDLRNLLKSHPEDPDARIKIAQTYIFEGNPTEAINLLRALLAEMPENKMVKQTLGQILTANGDPAQVQEGLQLLEEVAGPSGLAPGGREFALAQAAMREARQKAGAGDYQASTLKYQEAEQRFAAALKEQPENYLIAARLSQLAEMRGDLVAALAQANRAASRNPQFAINEARLYARLGQYRRALDKYQPLLKANPDNVGLRLEYANLQARAGQYAEALKTYESIIRDHPENGPAYTGKAEMLTSLQNIDTAADFLRETVRKQSKLFEPSLALAHLLLQMDKSAEAEELLAGVVGQLNTQLTEAKGRQADANQIERLRGALSALQIELAMVRLINGHFPEAIQGAEDAQRTKEEIKIEADVLTAVAEIQQLHTDRAIQMLKGLETREGNLASFIPILKSQALILKGDIAGAQAAVKNQPDLNTNSLELYLGLFKRHTPAELAKMAPPLTLESYLAQRPLFAAAVVKLTEATLAQFPDEPFVLARRAEAQQVLGRNTAALETYEKLAKAVPDYAPVLLVQMDLRIKQAGVAKMNGDATATTEALRKAEELGRRAVQLSPQDTSAMMKLAAVYQQMGRMDEANDLYRQIIKLEPGNAMAQNNLAWNLSEAGKLPEAATAAQSAVDSAPNQGGVLDTLGWIEFRQGNFTKAADLLGRASRLAPGNPEIRFHLAQSLEKAGQKQAAVATLETMLLAWPGFVRAGEVRTALNRLAPDSPALKAVPAAADQPTSGPTAIEVKKS